LQRQKAVILIITQLQTRTTLTAQKIGNSEHDAVTCTEVM